MLLDFQISFYNGTFQKKKFFNSGALRDNAAHLSNSESKIGTERLSASFLIVPHGRICLHVTVDVL